MIRAKKLEVKERKEIGKNQVKKIRKEGWVPGVIYGHGEKSRLIKVKEEDLKELIHSLHSEATLLNLRCENEDLQVIIREVTRNPLNEKLLHVDFQHIHEEEEVSVHVMLEFVGKAKGVEEGGILNIEHRYLTVKCLPRNIPEKITVDISSLGIGQSLHVKDLKVPEMVKVEEDPYATIVNVLSPRKIVEVAPTAPETPLVEEVAEPEVISKAASSEKAKEEQKEESEK
ncbi:MAG: 50S ribosomal protein L25 [candidate division WOR-3 bacterium]